MNGRYRINIESWSRIFSFEVVRGRVYAHDQEGEKIKSMSVKKFAQLVDEFEVILLDEAGNDFQTDRKRRWANKLHKLALPLLLCLLLTSSVKGEPYRVDLGTYSVTVSETYPTKSRMVEIIKELDGLRKKALESLDRFAVALATTTDQRDILEWQKALAIEGGKIAMEREQAARAREAAWWMAYNECLDKFDEITMSTGTAR